MTRGKGIYDDEEGSAASKSVDTEKDPDRDTPDVDKDADEPTA
ncbi:MULTISPECIES: hypothetical protein [Mycolicibacterium]|mgnify:CR=1 FL=1|jgi:hypothetical protein|uniref:Preprotein translocase YidC n=1 Tax=Mycolicibacterium austroafricanum TaxID=39687 RepID=A0ABT8HFP3_MYCAO|nr:MULTISPECIES: hypothetical protein [Mycolicibacterium]MDN4519593.1 hypothetical protein [Mycolicibacterium austroafricanum]WND56315.1 hypothetical protein QQA43_27215 [Mycolicibacterium vanbaalenii]